MTFQHLRSLASGRLLATIAAAAMLLATAPAWNSSVAHAQQCASEDPPCPTPPPLAVGVQAPGDTVRANPVTVSFTVTGVSAGALSSSATLDGAAIGAPTWQYESNGASVSGYVQVSPTADGAHTVTITFCESGRTPSCASDGTSFVYKAPPPPPSQGNPIIAQESGSSVRRSLSGCASCVYTTLSYSTPAYRSLDQDRSLTLLYSSATSAPFGQVVLDVNPNSTTAPNKISVSLKRASGELVTLANGQTEVFYAGGSGAARVTAQFDATSEPGNVLTMTAIVRNWWGASWLETQVSVKAIIVNKRSSSFGFGAFGNGWSVAGVQQLRLPGGEYGEAMFEDNDRAVVFANCGQACWTPPPGEGSTFAWGQNGRLHRRYADGAVAEFDHATGLQAVIRDRLGLQTSFTYDAQRRLTQIMDPAGISTFIVYSGPAGVARTASITGPSSGGRTVLVNIGANDDLISIIDPDNVTAMSVASSNNRIISVADRIGGATTYTYDSHGSLATVTGPAVTTDDRGFARSTTTYRSREAALLPAPGSGTSINPGGRVIPDTTWIRVTSQRGDNVKWLSNGVGDAVKTITVDPLGKADSTLITYNVANQPATMWSSSGARMEYRWSGHLLTQVVDNVANVTTDYSYNGLGQPTVVRVNQAIQQTNFYSADSRSVLDSSKAGTSVSRYTSDALARVLTAIDGGGHQSSFVYEAGALQNLASVTKNGKTTQFAYDGLGRPVSVTDALGQTSSMGYDVLNRPSSVSAPGRGTASWGYNDASRTYTFTDGKLQQYTAVANALGATMAEYNPYNPSLSDQYRYDSDGNLSSVTTRAQRTRQITRDLLGRPTQISAGGLATTIAYDTARKWTAYNNAESTDTIFVDGDGRVTKQTTFRPGGPSTNPGLMRFTLLTTYGAQGQRRSLTVSSPLWNGVDVRSETDVDALLRPNFVGAVDGSWTSIGYNPDERPLTISFPQLGTSTRRRQSLTYTGADRLASSTSNVAPDALSWSYGYDGLERLSQLSQGEGTYAAVRTATFDAAGRLGHWTDYRTVDLPPQWVCDDPYDELSCYWYYGTQSQAVRDSTYSYDAVGNRTDLGATVAAGNRLTAFNGYTLAYDEDGNLVSKTGNGTNQTFAWNAFGQLDAVTTNGSTTTFGYDGLGRRVRKTVDGVMTRSLHDGDNLVVQTDREGTRQLEFSYYPGIDQPHAVRQSATGNLYYYATSQPGHVTALVDRYDQVVNRYEYAPFGASLSATGPVVQPFRFAGRELDAETGLYYNRARYYDPALARFISEDPIGLEGGVNTYAYTENDPINYRDPTGLETTCSEWTLTWKQTNEDHWVGTLTCTGVTTLDRVTVTARGGGGGTPSDRGGRPWADTPAVGAGGATGRSAPGRMASCMANGTVENFMEAKQGVRDLIGLGGQLAAGMALGSGAAKAIGVPRIGGVILKYGAGVARSALVGGIAPQLTATVAVWEMEYVGGMALGAGVVGSAITAPLVYGALNFGYLAGSVGVSTASCFSR